MRELHNKTILTKFLADESGPTAVEYAVMLTLVAVACLSAVLSLGNATAKTMSESSNVLSASMSSAAKSGNSNSGGAGNGKATPKSSSQSPTKGKGKQSKGKN